MEELKVIKIGGNVLDNEHLLSAFVHDFAKIPGKKLLVHGGGKIATRMAEELGYQTTMIDGKRVTDGQMLEVITMVYGGGVNKKLVAALQKFSCNAIGLTGADGNIIRSSIRPVIDSIDYGFVGDIVEVNAGLLKDFISSGLVPVLAPITHDSNGQLFNTNADNIASHIAMALSEHFNVSLIYTFELSGVLTEVNDPSSKIDKITKEEFVSLKERGIIKGGMIAKLEACFKAISKGVKDIVICHSSDIMNLDKVSCGTKLIAS